MMDSETIREKAQDKVQGEMMVGSVTRLKMISIHVNKYNYTISLLPDVSRKVVVS